MTRVVYRGQCMARRGLRSGARPRQRGAALLTAMIIVVLVSTLATSMVWQQWRSIQVEEAERARVQSSLILTGALDWARLILSEDSRGAGGNVDDLNEPWAVPLAEARLSTFLAADRDATDGGPEAFLSGTITDAQSRYNLANLLDGATPGKANPQEQEIVTKLFGLIGVSQDVANRIVTNLLAAQITQTSTDNISADKPLMPESIQELAWFGIDAETIKRLEPYVALFPRSQGRSPININTAPREVIAASIKSLDLAGAERFVQRRQQSPFKSPKEVQDLLPSGTIPPAPTSVDVKSKLFEVRGRLRLGDRVLEERSLVYRDGRTTKTIQRQRVSSRDPTAS